ncbi:MFS transporter [Georgenia yuyongxinii]|uniref:MFS transporter n=1 Tax=Georgenia yuyongxinii TaxID=2589797 RepID=A0A5B8C531_9MICO|nr:MFS transporter [Georgenia yuyongxinii]QDC25693.1 MFS transporter [Georgenia yuyongxinii]
MVVPDKLWSRGFVLACVINLTIATNFFLLMVTMALYAVDRFSASDSMAGLASSMFVIGAIVVRVVAGTLTEAVGRRRMLLLMMAVFVVVSLAYLPSSSMPLLLIVRFVHGMAHGLATTAVVTIAQSLVPPLRRGEGTGYFTLGSSLAAAVGSFLGVTLIERIGYEALFWASFTLSVVGVVVTLALRVPSARPASARRVRTRGFRVSNLLEPTALPVATFMLLVGVAYSGVITFVNSYAIELDLATGAGAFFLVYSVVLFGARLVAGRVQDLRGDNVVMYPSLVLFVAGLLAIAVARTDAVLLLSAALLGAGFGTLMSSGQAIAVARVMPHRMGLAVSTYFLMLEVGMGLGPLALGAIVTRADYRVMFLVTAAIAIAAAAHYALVHGRHRRGSAGPA